MDLKRPLIDVIRVSYGHKQASDGPEEYLLMNLTLLLLDLISYGPKKASMDLP